MDNDKDHARVKVDYTLDENSYKNLVFVEMTSIEMDSVVRVYLRNLNLHV